MSKRLKKLSLVIFISIFLVGAICLLFLLILGMNSGYESALIENKIKDNCNCKNVAVIDRYPTPGSNGSIANYFSGKVANSFNIQLTDCDYKSFKCLSRDILIIVKKEELCLNKNIVFNVNDSGRERIFIIENCFIKN